MNVPYIKIEKFKTLTVNQLTKTFIILVAVLSTVSTDNICGGRITDPYNKMSTIQAEDLCNRIMADDRFIFNIQPDIDTARTPIFYDNDANSQFLERCEILQICKTGYFISVYFQPKLIRITAGSAVSQVATVQERDKVIKVITPYLRERNYYQAFKITFDMLRIFKPKGYVITKTTTTTTVRRSTGMGFWGVFFFIIIPIVLICLCLYCYWQKQSEEERVSIARGNYSNTSNGLYDHINKLESLIRETQVNPIIRIDYCLICFNSIIYNPPNAAGGFIEMQDLNKQQNSVRLLTQDPHNTRFECDHIFHTSCLASKKVNFCLLCKSADYGTPSMKVQNNNSYQFLKENELRTMIQNLKFLYSKDEVIAYTRTYPDHYRSHNTVIIIDDYHHYHPYHNDVYIHNNYYGGGSYESAQVNSVSVETGYVDSGIVNSAGGGYGDGNSNNYGGGYSQSAGGDYGGGYNNTSGGNYDGNDD